MHHLIRLPCWAIISSVVVACGEDSTWEDSPEGGAPFAAGAGARGDGDASPQAGAAGMRGEGGGNAGVAGSLGAGGTDSGLPRGDLPPLADNGASPYFPPIADQGVVGACDWFAAVYYQMSYTYNRLYDREAASDNTFSPKFGYNILNNGGIYPFNIRLPDVYEFVLLHGCATMAELPYDMAGGSGYREWCTDSDVWESALHDRIAGYESFRYDPTGDDPGDFGDFGEYYLHVKSLLDSGEVIVFQSNPDPVRIDFGAVADDESTSEDDDWVGETVITRGLDGPDHTMALVGYNDLLWVDTNDDGEVQSAERGAFRIADSFGTDVPFHEDGFLWLAYQALDDAIFEDRFFTLQVRENYVPSKIARITLHHARRDELKFQFGRAAEASSDGLSDWVFDPYGLGYGTGAAGVSLIDGAACSFDGSSEATEASFAFDLTDLDGSEGGNYWYLRIVNEGSSPLTIRDFTIVGRESEELWVDSELPVTAVEEEVLRFVEVSPR